MTRDEVLAGIAQYAQSAEDVARILRENGLTVVPVEPADEWKMVICDDGYPMVCTEGDIICAVDRNHQPREEADRRNFRLIATAPRMRDALTFSRDVLRDVLKSFGPCEHDVGHCTCREQTAMRLVEEALLQAGEPVPQLLQPTTF